MYLPGVVVAGATVVTGTVSEKKNRKNIMIFVKKILALLGVT